MTYKTLDAIYDTANNFGGKAKIEVIKENHEVLWSYCTKVAEIVNGNVILHGTYSPTTLRHIKEFFKQNGFKAETKKQIEKDYL